MVERGGGVVAVQQTHSALPSEELAVENCILDVLTAERLPLRRNVASCLLPINLRSLALLTCVV